MEWWNLLCQRPPPQLPKVPRHSKLPLPSVSNIVVVYAFFFAGFWGWVSISSKEETYPTSTADSNQEWPCKGEGQEQESQA